MVSIPKIGNDRRYRAGRSEEHCVCRTQDAVLRLHPAKQGLDGGREAPDHRAARVGTVVCTEHAVCTRARHATAAHLKSCHLRCTPGRQYAPPRCALVCGRTLSVVCSRARLRSHASYSACYRVSPGHFSTCVTGGLALFMRQYEAHPCSTIA